MLRKFGLEKIICWDHQSGKAKEGLLQALDDQRKMIYLDILRHTPLGPMLGVREFLESVPPDVPAAVASSSSQSEILATLKKVGLYTKDKKYFRTLASGYEVDHGKPSQDVFFLAAKRLQEKPEDCIVFEDSMNGVKAAKKAGMQCIAIQAPRANEDLSAATVVLGSFKEINMELIKKL